MAPEVPKYIGRYEILGELGRGSMGCVYLALDPNIDRRIAIKVLDPVRGISDEDEAELQQRFVLEARAAGRLNHPGIVSVYDADTDPETGSRYIAMEWVDGRSLEQVIQESGALPVSKAVNLVEQVAVALDAAHHAGLVHRDIKPANLLLDRADRTKISDFGIAKFTALSHTAAGRLLGSPFYMSPEQIRSGPVDRRSDLFSLGVVLYHCVTGVVPFGGESLAGIAYKIAEIDPKPAKSLNPAVTDPLGKVIERALVKEPEGRFQAGEDFARALRGLEESSLPADPPRPRTGTVVLPRPEEPAAIEDQEETSGSASWLRRATGAAAMIGSIGLLGLLVAFWPEAEVPPAPAPRPVVEAAAEDPPEPTETELETTTPSRPSPRPTTPRRAARRTPTGAPGAALEAWATSDGTEATLLTPGDRQAEGASTPPSGGAGSSAPPPPSPGTLHVTYFNRLKDGTVKLWIDDRLVWSEDVSTPKGLLNRTLGNEVGKRLEVARGRHMIEVRIDGSEGKVRAMKSIWGEFEAGRTRRLLVILNSPTVLKLSWGQ